MATETVRVELDARNARRAAEGRSALLGVQRFLRLIPYLWLVRRDRALHRICHSTIALWPGRRAQLSLFVDPLGFLWHLIRQNHPSSHRTMRFAAPLETRPFWNHDATCADLEAHAAAIRAEFEAVHQAATRHPSSTKLVGQGAWNVYPFYKGGRRWEDNCKTCPETARLLDRLDHCCSGSDGIGQIVFSILAPGTTLNPHTGSTNIRLRYHLGLLVPEGATLKVGGEERSWQQGRALVFDDGLEHSAKNTSDRIRAVLLVDLWHPGLQLAEREFVSHVTTSLAQGRGD